ncbi:MAG: hypothetical protein AABX14_00015 [Candidatus Aenigmatarchaeota archaeon]|mgnify:CR=1 FL=1
MYNMGKRGVSSILGLNEDLYPEVKDNSSSHLGTYAVNLGLVGLAALGVAGCSLFSSKPPPPHGVISQKYIQKDVKLPGKYIGSGRLDAFGFLDCSNAVGCTDYKFFGQPEPVRQLYGRAQEGDMINWSTNPNPNSKGLPELTVDNVTLVKPSSLGDVPYEKELDVREDVTDRFADVTDLSTRETRVRLKCVYKINGFVQGVAKDTDVFYFLNVKDLDETQAYALRNNVSQHRTVIIRKGSGSRPGAEISPSGDQNIGMVINVPYELLSFRYRAKAEVKGDRTDEVTGSIDQKGVHIGGIDEAPCIKEPGYKSPCAQPTAQPASPAQPAGNKPTPAPKKTSQSCPPCKQ